MEITNIPPRCEVNIPSRVDQLRIAGILDELSEKFFPFECKFINLNAACWEEQIKQLNPHLLFVESAWNGYQKTWRGKFTSQNNIDLNRLVNWCKSHKIPTVFWNKEDPIHLSTFLGAAFLFDYVFTTDMDCVPLYKRLLGHNRVGVLPFATAIQLFNPIEIYQRKNAACFAGSYYAKREERRLDFESIADTLIKNYTLDIYDRNAYPGNPDYSFPERYFSYVKGTLPVDEIDVAYKGYKLGVTLNIVKHSSTMEARRIFELLGCNTLTISNSCLGIKNLFGDIVIYHDNPDRFTQQINTLLADESISQRQCLLGLRKVLQEHTYKERLEYLYKNIFGKTPQDTSPKIALFSIIKNQEEARRVKATFNRQNYANKQLFLFASAQSEISSLRSKSIKPLNMFHTTLRGDFDFYAYISPLHYYGKNYFTDLALSTRYAQVSVIGKSAHFSMDEDQINYHEELGAYQLIDQIKADRAMFAAHLLLTFDPNNSINEFRFENLPCLSIDAYNFCENFTGESCSEVDDIEVDSGISVDELYQISDSLTSSMNNYSLSYALTGVDLYKQAVIYGNNCRTELLPFDRFGFYTWGNAFQKIVIDRKVIVHNVTFINELTNKENIDVFIYGETAGNITFHINYYAENEELINSYLIHNRSCTTIPVPENAIDCRISITTKGVTQGLVKEILFGPRILRPIELSAQEFD